MFCLGAGSIATADATSVKAVAIDRRAMRTRRMFCLGAGSIATADAMTLKAVAIDRRP